MMMLKKMKKKKKKKKKRRRGEEDDEGEVEEKETMEGRCPDLARAKTCLIHPIPQ